MSLLDIRALVSVPDRQLVPPERLFVHRSTLHGQAHVARVMVHAFRLIEVTGFTTEARRLWAAVYLHDIARTHDGVCHRHGAEAWERLTGLPDVRELFARGGVEVSDYPAIEAAVTMHCRDEPESDHPHRRLILLLKDADGLDRVRLRDLDPRYFRHPEARRMVGFAERLYEESDRWLTPSLDYMVQMWPMVERLLED